MESNPKLESESFDINGIFPTCTDGFSWESDDHSNASHEYTTLCSKFYIAHETGNNSPHFSKLCRLLALYLDYITTKEDEESMKKNCCILFYYKMKKDIIDNFASNKNTNAKDYYEKMTEQGQPKISTTISKICMSYSPIIDDDVFKIIENLFEIYKWINIFNTKWRQRTTANIPNFRSWIEKLVNHPDKYKNQLMNELDKIIQIFKSYKSSWKSCPLGTHLLPYISEEWIEGIKIKINAKSANTKETEALNPPDLIIPGGNGEKQGTKSASSQALISSGTNSETNTGMSVGMIFISSSILIYTPYFSFLKPTVRKLRRMLNKNNKNNLGLMNTFYFE
ncbi:variable surface protein [Plasmodium gonderi]|uniref:Variable surface protein n=1 Tax=Plasmodium gonderi TaxID=77519 RepID=A0A1Y1JSK3_PLAGO|nr:variable surface protein [Plasmodium gonderi]GAW84435.1 variable surface protein [Plasmodium gonderi]